MSKLEVTDHALVRWLDRTGAFDVEQVRAALASSLERCADAAEQLGTTRYLIVADGLSYLVRDGKLVTVMEDRGVYHHARHMERPSA